MSKIISNDELKKQFVEYYKNVPVIKYGAMRIGKDRGTIYNWLKKDSAFSTQVKRARAEWVKKTLKNANSEFKLSKLEKKLFGELGSEENPQALRIVLTDEKKENRASSEAE